MGREEGGGGRAGGRRREKRRGGGGAQWDVIKGVGGGRGGGTRRDVGESRDPRDLPAATSVLSLSPPPLDPLPCLIGYRNRITPRCSIASAPTNTPPALSCCVTLPLPDEPPPNLELLLIMVLGCLVLPTHDGKTQLGRSPPANPALSTPVPLSITMGWPDSVILRGRSGGGRCLLSLDRAGRIETTLAACLLLALY